MYRYIVNGMKSRPFQVIQGVRQGGVTSTWYYLLYIDDLLRELDSLEVGCTIGSLRTSNPTLADDFLYSSLTKTGAEKGLKVADNHANRWQYFHHPAKCKLLVFSLVHTPSNATVKLGTSTISQAESLSHVGIEIHKSFKSSAAINARIAKGRSSLFSILSIDRETSLINPITIALLFEKVCLPSVLYGSELWHNTTAEDSLKLERFMRLAAKSIQKLPMRTRTDMALGMLGWLPMSARVMQRKLMFLQKLCTMPPDTLTWKIFDFRLNLYILKGCSNQLGYIPDILKISSK